MRRKPMQRKGFMLAEIILTVSIYVLLLTTSFKYIGLSNKEIAKKDNKDKLEYVCYSIANYLTGYSSTDLEGEVNGDDVLPNLDLPANFKKNLNVRINTDTRVVICTLGDEYAVYKIP